MCGPGRGRACPPRMPARAPASDRSCRCAVAVSPARYRGHAPAPVAPPRTSAIGTRYASLPISSSKPAQHAVPERAAGPKAVGDAPKEDADRDQRKRDHVDLVRLEVADPAQRRTARDERACRPRGRRLPAAIRGRLAFRCRPAGQHRTYRPWRAGFRVLFAVRAAAILQRCYFDRLRPTPCLRDWCDDSDRGRAGGRRGSRIGGDKALVRLAGRPLIDYPLAAAREAGLDGVVVAKRTHPPPPSRRPGPARARRAHAPAAGDLTALEQHSTVIALPCDMPFVDCPISSWRWPRSTLTSPSLRRASPSPPSTAPPRCLSCD